ncbi:uracil-DNA glycosylase [Oryzifoliimicrobium ureilyticus]|uniref:uracil-DNA glycosylase n=1 Tax=Oryzifoliimicrobium ureilyticus TaxID=3113724 RepID=UPI0030763A4A
MISAEDLSPAQLAALLAFHAEAGVEWLVEEEAIDRFAEFQAAREARQAAPSPAAQVAAPSNGKAAAAQNHAAPSPAARAPSRRETVIPDGEAIQQARFAAESATTLEELRTALENFEGCNLKRSARSTVFATGSAESGIMVIGSAPTADDDRDGIPFAGRCGDLLDKMLAAMGLQRDSILLTQAIAWRPPGNRTPSPAEADICKPFIERQIALAKPQAILLLGNFAARFFFGEGDSIHGLRGRWHEIAADHKAVPAMATMHPQDLITAPLNKRLVWRDLQHFKLRLDDLALLQK